jgi:hypothetical protein
MAKKEEVKKQPTQLTKPGAPLARPSSAGIEVPDYLRPKGRAAQGGENVDSTDVLIPRLGLCQSMSHERLRNDAKFIPGLEEGMFFNSVTGKIYGDKVLLIPAFFFRTRIRFKPLDEGGGIVCQALDGKTGAGDPGGNCLTCPMSTFHDDEPPECTEFKNFAAIIVPDAGLPTLEDAIVVGWKVTQLKAAKTLNQLLRMRGLDYYASIIEVTSATQKNDKGTFYVPVPKFTDRRTDCSTKDQKAPPSLVSPEVYAIGRSVYAGMKALQAQGKLKIDIESDDNPLADDDPGSAREM